MRPFSEAYRARLVEMARAPQMKHVNDRRQTCECRHRWADHSFPGWRCLAMVDDPDATALRMCQCLAWLPFLNAMDPELGPCSCQRCDDRCPRRAPRDEGSPDVCEDCLRGTHAGAMLP